MGKAKTYVFQNQVTGSFASDMNDNVSMTNAPVTLVDDLNKLRTQIRKVLNSGGTWKDVPVLDLYKIHSMFTGTLNINNLVVTGSTIINGDLTVLGSLSAISSTNTEIKDSIIGLGFASGSSAVAAGDRGWIGGLNGSDNVAMVWDNSAGEFVVGKTTSNVSSTDLTFSEYSSLHAGNIQGSIITASLGFSGSLTKLADGTPYLIAGKGIEITTGSNGSISITTVNENGNSFFQSTTSGSIFTTGSVAFIGNKTGIDSPLDIGSDVVFYVSGALSDSNKAVFGGDVRISGSLALGQSSAYLRVEDEPGSIVLSPHPDIIPLGNDTFFFVSGSPGDGDKSVFGGDLVASGTVTSHYGFSGSLTTLTDGTPYLIAGESIVLTTSSLGAITIGISPNSSFLSASAHQFKIEDEYGNVVGELAGSPVGVALTATGSLTFSVYSSGSYSLADPQDYENYTMVFGTGSLARSLVEIKGEGYAYYRKGTIFADNINPISYNLDITSVGTMRSGWDDTRDIDVYHNGQLLSAGQTVGDYYLIDDHTIHFNSTSFLGDDKITIIIKNAAGAPYIATTVAPPPAVAMGGDVVGDSNSSTVVRLRNRAISAVAPQDGYVYAWSNLSNAWVPTAPGSGPQGTQGYQGPQGYQGIAGAQGDQGVQGPQGDQGPQGPQGDAGLQGPQGDQGYQGLAGLQGPQGDVGPQGLTGDSFFGSLSAGSIFTTGSVALVGNEGITSANSKGSDVVFYVSGSINGNEKSLFGGDVRISGSLTVGTGSITITTNDLQFGSPSARFELSNGNIKVYDATNPSGSLLGAGTSGIEPTFANDITVSLSGGKTFGRYANGEIIPATGKTAREVILLVSAEPIAPTVSLNGTNPITSAFNTTSLTGSLTGNYTINSLGGSVSAARLQWRSGSSGNWNILSTSTSNPLNYTHTLDVPAFFTQNLNYQYIITDTLGAITTGSLTITPQSYAAPSISLSVAASNPGSVTGESNSTREKGNVASTITGTITRNRTNVPITSYSVQYQVNGTGSWTDVPGLSNVSVVGNPGSINIPSTSHNDVNLKSSNSLVYRVQVIDSYQTTTSSSSTITFYNVVFYGAVSAAPTTSTDVRAISNKIFTNGSNPFTLNTGNTLKDFTVAMPASLSLSSVVDLDALNANITSNYSLSTFNVNDAGGTATSYKVYTLSIATPYASNHRHQVTRA